MQIIQFSSRKEKKNKTSKSNTVYATSIVLSVQRAIFLYFTFSIAKHLQSSVVDAIEIQIQMHV